MSGDDSGSSDDSDPADQPREDGSPDGPADESDESTGDDPHDGQAGDPRDDHDGDPGSEPGAPGRRRNVDDRTRSGDSSGGPPGRGPDDRPGVPGSDGHGETPGGQRTDRGSPHRGNRQSSERPDVPPRRRSASDPGRNRGVRWWVHRFRTAESGPLMITREVLSSVLMVAAVGLLLFAISGVWPPMVAVQSGSMEPHMHKGDLVFVVDEHRFADDVAVEGTGVAPHAVAEGDGYEKFGNNGDVIVFEPNGNSRDVPIIHRARFWVDEGERWYDRADKRYVRADSCAELRHCPAPTSGFITKGDNNPQYDQATGMTRPVKPKWITGKAMVRIPALGYIRLIFSDLGHATAFVLGGVFLGSGLGLRRRPVVPRDA